MYAKSSQGRAVVGERVGVGGIGGEVGGGGGVCVVVGGGGSNRFRLQRLNSGNDGLLSFCLFDW